MKPFMYSGPECHVTLAQGKDGKDTQDVHLVNNAQVTLPENHAYVLGLIELKRLIPTEAASTNSAPVTETTPKSTVKPTPKKGAA